MLFELCCKIGPVVHRHAEKKYRIKVMKYIGNYENSDAISHVSYVFMMISVRNKKLQKLSCTWNTLGILKLSCTWNLGLSGLARSPRVSSTGDIWWKMQHKRQPLPHRVGASWPQGTSQLHAPDTINLKGPLCETLKWLYHKDHISGPKLSSRREETC